MIPQNPGWKANHDTMGEDRRDTAALRDEADFDEAGFDEAGSASAGTRSGARRELRPTHGRARPMRHDRQDRRRPTTRRAHSTIGFHRS
jgi:hypothetical protein